MSARTRSIQPLANLSNHLTRHRYSCADLKEQKPRTAPTSDLRAPKRAGSKSIANMEDLLQMIIHSKSQHRLKEDTRNDLNNNVEVGENENNGSLSGAKYMRTIMEKSGRNETASKLALAAVAATSLANATTKSALNGNDEIRGVKRLGKVLLLPHIVMDNEKDSLANRALHTRRTRSSSAFLKLNNTLKSHFHCKQ
jgi:hypothetical protein